MDRTRVIALTLALIAAIAVPLCASSGWARGLGVLGLGGGAVDYCTASVCAGCLIQERFECGSTAGDDDSDQETSITYSSAGANTNDAYTDTIITGSEGLYLQSAAYAQISVTPGDGDIYYSAIVKPLTFTETSSNNMMLGVDSGNLGIARIKFNYGAGPKIDSTSLWTGSTNDTITDDITDPTAARYWKVLYNNSTGAADGVMKVWYSATGAAGSWILRHDITNHTSTAQIAKIRVGASTNDAYLFKDIRSSSSDINY